MKPLKSDRPQKHIYIRHPDGRFERTKLTKNQLNAFGMTQWMNTYYLKDGFSAHSMNVQVEEKLASLIQQSTKIQDKMAITAMTAFEGYGVVARELIPKGSCILYTGVCGARDSNQEDNGYDVSLGERSLELSASHHGNMSRFMNYAPSSDSLDKWLSFDSSDIKQSVLTANFKMTQLSSSSALPLMVLEATRDIQVNEPLVWNYGSDIEYFVTLAREVEPQLFDRKGQVIASGYHWKFHHVTFYYQNSMLTSSLAPIDNRCDIFHVDKRKDVSKKLTHHIVIQAGFIGDTLEQDQLLAIPFHLNVHLPSTENANIKYVRHLDDVQSFLNDGFLKIINEIINPEKSILHISASILGKEHLVILSSDECDDLNMAMNAFNAHGVRSKVYITKTNERFLLINQFDLFQKLPSAHPSCLSAAVGLAVNSLLANTTNQAVVSMVADVEQQLARHSIG